MAVIQRQWRTWLAVVAILAGIFLLVDRRETSATHVDVTIDSARVFTELDGSLQDFDGAANGVFTVHGNLTLINGGSITCDDDFTGSVPNSSACAIAITGGGDLVMDAGSSIHAENTVAGGNGGNITIVIEGDLILHGPSGGTPGAYISSSRIAGSGAGDTGDAGDITIIVGGVTVDANGVATCGDPTGDVLVEKGAAIKADGPGDAGDIRIYAGRNITVDGLISAQGTTTVGRGGLIWLDACCDLFIDDDGQVISRGVDPGADLVHLEGCIVTIFGLVESTGPGHTFPADNHCNQDNVAHPILSPPDSANTGCIEVWSGTTITIDSTAPQNAELNADIGFTGGANGRGWIDLFARSHITIIGDTAGPYAVHANGGIAQNTDDGGLITVKSLEGDVVTTQDVPGTVGRAIQANATSAGSQGGDVIVEAGSDVTFTTASIQAEGDTGNNCPSNKSGGHISARAFNGFVTGSAPGELNAIGGGGGGCGTLGVVTLQGCGTAAPDDGVDYTGTVTPAPAVNPGDACGGSPSLPAGVTLPNALCSTVCRPGITPTPVEFTPTPSPTPTPTPFCNKEPVQTVLAGRVPDVVVRTDLGQSIQAAVTGATDSNLDGYIIVGVVNNGSGVLGGHVSQRVTVSEVYSRPFLLIGCSVTLHDPNKYDGLPTGLIAAGAGSPGNIFIMDLHGADSEVAGWKIEGNGRYVRNTGGSGSPAGIWFVGNSNTMHNGSGSFNTGVGLKIEGSFNSATDTDTFGNTSHGVQVSGNNNQILKVDSGESGKGNGGDGFNVTGNSNLLSEDDAFANKGNGFAIVGNLNQVLKSRSGDSSKGNGGDGYNVAGAGNILTESRALANKADGWDVSGGVSGSPNKFKNVLSNTGSSGSSLENVGPEYRLLGYVQNNGSGNKADNVSIPAAAKCPAFPVSPNTANVNFSCGD